ncbi:hypothetical protein [uncultured Shewanella sp.]|uniref:hypothetical protein n=1 Tax=uncultured Shewanella sp. TaxID=173975 RepID=UPI002618C388|nr:hypothetical protein [uncultured Shewanella sp.]
MNDFFTAIVPKKGRLVGAILIVLLLSACTATGSTQTRANNTYKGKPIQSLIERIGLPQEEVRSKEGNNQFNWLIKETIQVPVTSIHNGPPIIEGSDDEIDQVGSTSSERICQLSVMTDPNGIIQDIVVKQDTLGTEAFHFSMCEQVLE